MQPAGYNFEVKGKLLKEHECPICLQLIINATELPCSHLMCRDCLVYYEKNESKKVKNGNFLCCICKKSYYRKQKKKVKSVDRIIRESIDVKCKQLANGCDWSGCISNYESHHIKVCEFLLVECQNDGCNENIQRRDIERHRKSCEFSVVHCIYCEEIFLNRQSENHLKICLLRPVACRNEPCEEKVQRTHMESHCDKECQYQMVDCVYHDLGCDVQVPRHALKDHLKEDIHSSLLLKSHLALFRETVDLEKHCEDIIQQQTNTVKSLDHKVDGHNVILGVLKSEVDYNRQIIYSLKDEVKKKGYAITNLESICKKQCATSENLLNQVNRINYDIKESLEEQLKFKTKVARQLDQIVNSYSHAEKSLCMMERNIASLEVEVKEKDCAITNLESKITQQGEIIILNERDKLIFNIEQRKLNTKMTRQNDQILNRCSDSEEMILKMILKMIRKLANLEVKVKEKDYVITNLESMIGEQGKIIIENKRDKMTFNIEQRKFNSTMEAQNYNFVNRFRRSEARIWEMQKTVENFKLLIFVSVFCFVICFFYFK